MVSIEVILSADFHVRMGRRLLPGELLTAYCLLLTAYCLLLTASAHPPLMALMAALRSVVAELY